MDYIQFEVHKEQNENKGKRKKIVTPEVVQPARQRYQANARERDRTHRYDLI